MVVIFLPSAAATGITQEADRGAVECAPCRRPHWAMAAAVLGAGETDLLADRPEQGA